MNIYSVEVVLGSHTHTMVVVAESTIKAQARTWEYLRIDRPEVAKQVVTTAVQEAKIEQLDLSCAGVAFQHSYDSLAERTTQSYADHDIPF